MREKGTEVRGESSPGRIVGIDRARGVSVLLVCLGHHPYAVANLPAMNMVLSWIRIPLLFMVAGHFVSIERPFLIYVWGRAKRLIFPFVLWMGLVVGQMALSHDQKLSTAVWSMVLLNAESVQRHLWFLPVLFAGSCLTWVLLRFVRGIGPWKIMLLGWVLILLGGALIRDGRVQIRGHLAFASFDLLPLVVGYLVCAWGFRRATPGAVAFPKMAIFPVLAALVVLPLLLHARMDFFQGQMDSFLLLAMTPLFAAACIAMLNRMSLPGISDYLVIVGKHSILLFLVHNSLEHALHKVVLARMPTVPEWVSFVLTYVVVIQIPVLQEWFTTHRRFARFSLA